MGEAIHKLALLAFLFGFWTCVLPACDSGGIRPLDPQPCDGDGTIPLSDELLAELARQPGGAAGSDTKAGSPAAPPACRPATEGDLVVNEVMSRPAGRDLDGDGWSNSNDEAVEIVSIAADPVHIQGARLVYAGKVRGSVATPTCLLPFHAAVLVGSKAADFATVKGSWPARLDRTLRLTDSGGVLALVGTDGSVLDKVAVPLAKGVTEGCITRERDADATAALLAHALLAKAQGRTWSPGRCADGGLFPRCVAAEVVARTFEHKVARDSRKRSRQAD